VQAFLHRRIEGDWPYLWLDATYVKVRQSGRIVSMAVITAGLQSPLRRFRNRLTSRVSNAVV
jgi:transposase-like protein